MNKIRIFVVTAFFLAVSAGAFAQAEVSLGLKGGVNFAKLDVSGGASDAFKSRTGYHLGAFGLVKISKFAIQPEIVFSQQGSEVKDPDLGSVESNFSYVNIPVLLKFYLVAGLNVQAGPQFGFLTSAKYDGENIKDQLKGSDISAALGLGWDLPFGLTVDGRYNLGLSNVSDASENEIKNQVWQLSVGYKLFKFGN